MHTFSSLPFRRRLVMIINAVLLVPMMLSYFFIDPDGDGSDLLIILLLAYPVLALFQWCCALYNILRGSRLQLFYLLASIFYLLIYFAVAFSWIDLPIPYGHSLLYHLAVGTPLIFAAVFSLILYFDHPNTYRRNNEKGDVLDAAL